MSLKTLLIVLSLVAANAGLAVAHHRGTDAQTNPLHALFGH